MKPLVAEWVQDKFLPNRKMFHTRFAQVAKIAKNEGKCGVNFSTWIQVEKINATPPLRNS
jgi:hypothetical protein